MKLENVSWIGNVSTHIISLYFVNTETARDGEWFYQVSPCVDALYVSRGAKALNSTFVDAEPGHALT